MNGLCTTSRQATRPSGQYPTLSPRFRTIRKRIGADDDHRRHVQGQVRDVDVQEGGREKPVVLVWVLQAVLVHDARLRLAERDVADPVPRDEERRIPPCSATACARERSREHR